MRPRFSLRALLILVAIVAVAVACYPLPHAEVRRVSAGMSRDQVREELGSRYHSEIAADGERWHYLYTWGRLILVYPGESEPASKVRYYLAEDSAWYER